MEWFGFTAGLSSEFQEWTLLPFEKSIVTLEKETDTMKEYKNRAKSMRLETEEIQETTFIYAHIFS